MNEPQEYRIWPDAVRLLLRSIDTALVAGEITNDEYGELHDTLKGIPRNPKCSARVFHGNPAHVC